mmetsp:Transcript_12417/g.9947  ORF Transcript_12417/g.9947 Transcript_12417/m.9947 type:complete len:116 (-) Transcript_12417:186-533(-)
MKTLVQEETIKVPKGIKIEIKSKVVTVSGKHGSLTRNFKHCPIELKLTNNSRTVMPLRSVSLTASVAILAQGILAQGFAIARHADRVLVSFCCYEDLGAGRDYQSPQGNQDRDQV